VKTRLLLFLVSACLGLSGCAPSSVHPLYTDQDAVVDPALEGTWSSGSDQKAELGFQKSGDHKYDLAILCKGDKSECPNTEVRQNDEVNLVRLGGQLFMDLAFKDQTIDGVEVDEPLGVLHAHVIVKVKISGDELAYATLDEEAIRKQSISGSSPLDYYQMSNEIMLVTAQTEALRAFVSAHTEEVFSDFEHLSRKTACSAPEHCLHN
jgi:hypothetical protein